MPEEPTQEEGLPQEAVAAINQINEERETELQMQQGSPPGGDEVSSPEAEVTDADSGQQEVEQQQAPQVDEALLQRAQAFGLDAAKYSPEDLQSRLDDFDRMFSSKGQQFLQQHQQMRNMPQGYPQPQQPQQQPQQSQPDAQQQQAWSFGLDEDYGDLGQQLDAGAQKLRDEVLGYMNTMAGVLMQQQQAVQTWQQQQSQAAMEREANEFHDAVQSIGDEVFGNKAYSDLKPGSAEAKALEQLGDNVRTMALGLQAAGLPVPPMKELVSRAYRVAFHDRIESRLKAEQNKRLQEASRTRMGGGGRVAAPHGHNPPGTDDPTRNPKLIEAFEAWSQ